MKAYLEKTCKPSATSKDYISIFRLEKNDKFTFLIRLYWDGITKDELVSDYSEALYKFYYNLCWLLDDKTMSETMNQRIKGTREINPIQYNLQKYFKI